MVNLDLLERLLKECITTDTPRGWGKAAYILLHELGEHRSGVASAPTYTGAIIQGENGPIKVVADVMQPTLDKPAIGYVEDGPAAAGVRRESPRPSDYSRGWNDAIDVCIGEVNAYRDDYWRGLAQRIKQLRAGPCPHMPSRLTPCLECEASESSGTPEGEQR